MTTHRAGYVGLLGRPNVGKSTLLNNVLGQKVAATADKPQTTRNRIAGIYSTEDAQIVIVDTPGIHRPRGALNSSMVKAALETLNDVSVACWMIDGAEATRQARKEDREILGGGDTFIANALEDAGCPIVIAVNKIDLVDPRWLLPVIEAYSKRFPKSDIIPISAAKGEGTSLLLEKLISLLPENPPLFPKDQLIEQSERFVVSEIIREKLVRYTKDEIPYSTAVEIEQFDEQHRDDEKAFIQIHARIIVERQSQKGIVIGKQGSMLKKIGTESRQEIQKLLGARVRLDLFVAVEEDWTSNPRLLKELGYE